MDEHADIGQIRSLLQGIHDRAVELESRYAAELNQVRPEHVEGARNLVHYLALRKADTEQLRNALAAVPDWDPEALHQVVKDVAVQLDLKLGKVAQPLRVAVVGRAASPGIDVTLHLVGREACLRRIDRALDYIRQRTEQG